jgi:hypothetical protein
MLRFVADISLDSQLALPADLLSWLLFVGGGMTDRKDVRTQVSQLIHRMLPKLSGGDERSWETLRDTLKNFIWCEYTMEHRIHQYWKEVYQISKYGEEPGKKLDDTMERIADEWDQWCEG